MFPRLGRLICFVTGLYDISFILKRMMEISSLFSPKIVICLSGLDGFSCLDLLHENKLVNYFGKASFGPEMLRLECVLVSYLVMA